MTQTYELIIVQETQMSWGVREEDDPLQPVIWLPKSRVERGRRRGTTGVREVWEFEIPEWLAIEKGLA